MIKNDIISLVKSLTTSEKRSFKLFCKKQSGSKDYMNLFKIIERSDLVDNPEDIVLKFKKSNPRKSFDNTAQYLLKQVTGSLIQIATTNNPQFQQYFAIMRSKMLLDRSISQEGIKELKKAQKLASNLQNPLLLFHTFRQELEYLSKMGFPGMTEDNLIEMQMKAKKNLRQLHQIQEHYSLFELLRFRLIYSGRSLSEEDKMKLNDLVTSELGVISRGIQHNFESNKIHLLFQAFFLIHIGRYKSSLQSFKELNELFESNESQWNFPPYDYLYTLEGILDNLRSIKYYDEMDFFIEQIKKLLKKNYPEHFETVAWQTIYIFKMNLFINKGDPSKAIKFSESIPTAHIKNNGSGNLEKHVELLFHIAVALFHLEYFQKASKKLVIIKALGKVKINSGIQRASWLMHILLHYELDDLLYLDYEIRSYKRTFKKTGKILEIERLVFKIIKHDPKRKKVKENLKLWDKIQAHTMEIDRSSYERQILKYYDFNFWIRNKLSPP